MTYTKQVLLEAADRIERAPKLAKGSFVVYADDLDEDGRVLPFEARTFTGDECFCALGAINCGEGGLMLWDTAVYKLTQMVGSAVPEWNDAPERTKEEVVAVLREVAGAL